MPFAFADSAHIAQALKGSAVVVEIADAMLCWQLNAMKDGRTVYGGAMRLYPASTTNDGDERYLYRMFSKHDGVRAADQVIADVMGLLTHGLGTATATVNALRVNCTVQGIVGQPGSALCATDTGGYVNIYPQEVFSSMNMRAVQTDRVFAPDMRIAASKDPDTGVVSDFYDGLAMGLDAATLPYKQGDTVLVRVAAADANVHGGAVSRCRCEHGRRGCAGLRCATRRCLDGRSRGNRPGDRHTR